MFKKPANLAGKDKSVSRLGVASQIARYDGDLSAFASGALTTERTTFGDTTQSDNLTTNINANFLRGWAAGLDETGFPTMQWFNAVSFVNGQLHAYYHQVGIPQWNVAQTYYTNGMCNYNGTIYVSLVDSNVGNQPNTSLTDWIPISSKVLASAYAAIDFPTQTPTTDTIDTTPSSGTEYLSFSITPTLSSSRIVLNFTAGGLSQLSTVSGARISLIDATSSTILDSRYIANTNPLAIGSPGFPLTLQAIVSSSSTTARTYAIMFGVDTTTGGTAYVNSGAVFSAYEVL